MAKRADRHVATASALAVALGLALLAGGLLRPGRTAAPGTGSDGPLPMVEPLAGAPPPVALPAPLLPAGPVAAEAEAAPEPPLVEGRVVARETGLGIPGADVTFSRGGAAAGARTGADGAFRFEPPVEGRWLLAAVIAPGFLPFAPEWGHSPVAVDARVGQPVRGVELRLSRATPLVGKVVDGEGAPVPSAEVRLLGVRGVAALVALAERFTADGAGEFRFAAPRGTIVEARKPGLGTGRAEVGARATVERRLLVRLRPARGDAPAPDRIAGRVVERGTGAPIAGALVVAERETRWGGLFPAGQAVSGPDGRFGIPDLSEGAYRLSASAEGRARGSLAQVAAGAGDATLELARGGIVRGCVRDGASGRAVSGFTVTIVEGRAPPVSRSFLDASGCWSVGDAGPGPASVSVAAPGFVPSDDVAVEVPESGEAVADVRLSPGRVFRGVVVDAATRAPIAGTLVSLQGGAAPDPGGVVGAAEETWTDGQGRFQLAGLSGRFSLEVTAPGHHVRVAGGLQVADGQDPPPVVISVTPLAPGEEPQREITGIGIGIAPRDGAVVVTGVVAGGGAAAVGLVAGDAIVRIDGVPVSDLGFAGAANAIRGPEGTSVRLTLRRGDGTIDVWVGRGIVRG
jgi:hypothetical protein